MDRAKLAIEVELVSLSVYSLSLSSSGSMVQWTM
jgi:hypothetical protein